MKVRSDQVKHALAGRHTDDLFLTEVKTGRTWDNKELLKFDALAMKKSWANPCLTGYEVKVSRSDFLQDQKWVGYMAYCHKFSFVCPKGLIQKDELPEEVGLIWYYPDTGALRSVRTAKHRMIDIPPDLYMYMLMSRTKSDRHPFFSSQRECLEAYVLDKSNRVSLGRDVSSKLVNEISELRKQAQESRYKTERLERESELLDEVRNVLLEYGIRLGAWNKWQEEIRQRLSSGMSPQFMKLLEGIEDKTSTMKRLLGDTGS